MSQHPFLVQEFFIDRQNRERIIRVEREIISNEPAQSENSSLLHPVELAPKFRVLSEIVELKLLFIEISSERNNAQLNVARAEFARGQPIESELNRIAAHKLLPQFRDSRVGSSRGNRKRFRVSRFVIDDPQRSAGELRIRRASLRENEIDPASDAKFVSCRERHFLRFEVPFGGELRPAPAWWQARCSLPSPPPSRP